MSGILKFLRSAGLARAVLIALASYVGVCAWLPWLQSTRDATAPIPSWATALWLDHPFSSPPFLAGVALLWASTLACTWGRRARLTAIWRGTLPLSAVSLAVRPGRTAESFLRGQGFSGSGVVLRRWPVALFGGWLLHVGLLALIAGVLVQQAFSDGGTFVLSEGETVQLRDPGAVFDRTRGPLAPKEPPGLTITLEAFDPYRHQAGYAPDRQSKLSLHRGDGLATLASLDRSQGVELEDVEIFQAIPMGIALELEVGGAIRALHLQPTADPKVAQEQVTDPAGQAATWRAQAERSLLDPTGTGPLAIELEQAGSRTRVEPGKAFAFGGQQARLARVSRWTGFTYARSPGISFVLIGFLLVLAGAALLALPAGVARLPTGGEVAAVVYLARGGEALKSEWERPEPSEN